MSQPNSADRPDPDPLSREELDAVRLLAQCAQALSGNPHLTRAQALTDLAWSLLGPALDSVSRRAGIAPEGDQ